MHNKLIIAKSRFFMTNEDREKLSVDMQKMVSRGTLIVGNEIEQLLIMNIDSGDIVTVKDKEETNIKSGIVQEKKYTAHEIMNAVKNIFSRKKK